MTIAPRLVSLSGAFAGLVVLAQRERVARVRLASTPEDRFVAQVAAIQAQIDRLPDEAVRAILREVAALRQQTLTTLATVNGFEAHRLATLEAQLRDLGARFVDQYGRALAQYQDDLRQLGAELAARPLVAAGVAYHVPQISRRQVEAAAGLQSLLIQRATDAPIAKVLTELRLATLQGSTVPEVLQRIAGSLGEPGPFGSIEVRAEAIARTELGRVQSIATQSSLEQIQASVPDLRKQWLHSRNRGPYRRLGHIEADGQVRNVDERFRIRKDERHPYEDLLYPRAANASPANTVFGGCVSAPYRDEWAGAIEAARTEDAVFRAERSAA
jgi:hypothetical protein